MRITEDHILSKGQKEQGIVNAKIDLHAVLANHNAWFSVRNIPRETRRAKESSALSGRIRSHLPLLPSSKSRIIRERGATKEPLATNSPDKRVFAPRDPMVEKKGGRERDEGREGEKWGCKEKEGRVAWKRGWRREKEREIDGTRVGWC